MQQAKGSATSFDSESESLKALRTKVQDLHHRIEKLEAQRHQLLEENRRLRREITQSRLVEDLKVSTAVGEDETPPSSPVPPTAEDLYLTLPASFTYEEFFQIAQNAGLDTEEVRQSLRIFLRRGMVTQEGSRLTKKLERRSDVDDREVGRFSRLAA